MTWDIQNVISWLMSLWLWPLVIFFAVLFGWYVITIYNKLAKRKINIENAFSDVDVYLKSRFNLVDNIVATVKWYASHEKDVFMEVTKARNIYNQASSDNEKIQADGMLSNTLKSLFAVSESYPDLKADKNFLQLQNEMSRLENDIIWARKYYNAMVNDYTLTQQTFPSNIINKIFWFPKKEYFRIEDEQKRQNPEVSFS